MRVNFKDLCKRKEEIIFVHEPLLIKNSMHLFLSLLGARVWFTMDSEFNMICEISQTKSKNTEGSLTSMGINLGKLSKIPGFKNT